jgi:hypothetical protein
MTTYLNCSFRSVYESLEFYFQFPSYVCCANTYTHISFTLMWQYYVNHDMNCLRYYIELIKYEVEMIMLVLEGRLYIYIFIRKEIMLSFVRILFCGKKYSRKNVIERSFY